MFVIAVYDVGEKRVAKVLKTCRKYLYWVQNSVLEGDINESTFKKLKLELAQKIDKDYDSVIFYTFRSTKYSEREIMGQEKGGSNNFL
ncbi:MAG: CRISPR-associated endonuclease Cas2 [Syntrophomonadaceae bacterium]|nr:CRISPR-associated endonuclease Cas2 [Syntrophomonadaceae bacterium]